MSVALHSTIYAHREENKAMNVEEVRDILHRVIWEGIPCRILCDRHPEFAEVSYNPSKDVIELQDEYGAKSYCCWTPEEQQRDRMEREWRETQPLDCDCTQVWVQWWTDAERPPDIDTATIFFDNIKEVEILV